MASLISEKKMMFVFRILTLRLPKNKTGAYAPRWPCQRAASSKQEILIKIILITMRKIRRQTYKHLRFQC